jgi:glycosyltransferase involved in cell wall biosynthesis
MHAPNTLASAKTNEPVAQQPAGSLPFGNAKRLLINLNVGWFLISHRMAIAQAAQANGFEVHVAADIESDEEISTIANEGLIFHRVSLARGSMNPLRDLRYLLQIAAVIRRIKPHIIHNVTAKPVIYGSLAARVLRVGHVINAVAGLGHVFSGRGQSRLLSNLILSAFKIAMLDPANRVIFQNPDDRNVFLKSRIITADQAVLIAGSGVDLNAFRFDAEPAGKPRVVLPARMLPDKGIIEFAGAANLLRSRGCNAEFLLAGRTDDKNPTGMKAPELGELEGTTGVKWLGHVTDMPALYRSAHIVCLPSYYGEGVPKALIEACAAGRPIVTTDTAGCRDVVTDGVNGLIVKPRDVESLASALERLLGDAALRSRMGAEGRLRAEREFDIKSVVKATLDQYRQMLG